MKIDGTDAISSMVRSSHGSSQGSTPGNMPVNNQETAAVKEARAKEGNLQNLSMMSDFEKRGLPISDKVVLDAIEKANRAISGANRRFEFSVHEKTKDIMVKVIDTDTNQVIREIPNEGILDMVAKMEEMAGLMVDERR